MMMHKYRLIRSAQFSKEVKRAKKRGLDMKKLDDLVDKLRNDIPLDIRHDDHPLRGQYKDFRECHITPDWLLIYKKHEDELILFLARTGTHSDLFH